MVAVVTAVYGKYDKVQPQAEQNVPCEWRCYTDDPHYVAPAPWETFYERPHYADPRMAAKVPKMLVNGQPTVWIDANMQVTHEGFVKEALAQVHDGLAVHRHPRRDCIYAEAEASLGAEGQNGKYRDQPIPEQMKAYRVSRHPEHGGLYACGTIAYDGVDPRFGPSWLAECLRWSVQDQLSFPVVCQRLGIQPGVFSHPQIEGKAQGALRNRWMLIHPHLRD